MSFRDFIVQEFAFQTHHDLMLAENRRLQINLRNSLTSIFLLIPIVNTICGIVCLILPYIYDSILKPGGIPMTDSVNKKYERIGKIVICSVCIASLGILLVPLIIAATIMKLQHQARNQAPEITNRKVTEIPPDFLL